MVLRNKTQNLNVADKLLVAKSFWARTKGLLGRKNLPNDEALWIHRCNSIHTFFMNFPIDLVFVSKDLVVKDIRKDVQPGKLVWPVWSASSVIEFMAGTVGEKVRVGDQLHVDC